MKAVARFWQRRCLFVIFTISVFLNHSGVAQTIQGTNPSTFNYVIGTQTIDPRYSFTSDDPLVEMAKVLQNMGSNIIKFQFDDTQGAWQVLDMPFQYNFMWWNWYRSNLRWGDGLSQEEKDDEWNKTYAMTRRLLERYNNSGRVFFLGNWEGDWLLAGATDPTREPTSAAIQGMIDWFDIRQSAVDKAKRDTPHSNVQVYHYIEVNRVVDALRNKRTRVVNAVLPKVWGVDYVSYSAYDVQRLPAEEIRQVLDYIESQTPAKAGIQGRRVFIGEFGIAARWTQFDPIEHERQNREIMGKFLSWGVPFLLYWELYNNELNFVNPANPAQSKPYRQATDEEKATWTPVHNGFWLIDDKNQKQPLYYTFERTLAKAKNYVEDFKNRQGRLPDASEYQNWLQNQLRTAP